MRKSFDSVAFPTPITRNLSKNRPLLLPRPPNAMVTSLSS